MKSLLWVFVGGGMGSIARFSVSLLLQTQSGSRFPWATLFVNSAGGFLIGILGAIFLAKSPAHPMRLLLVTGFLGGFTTFSAFSLETLLAFTRGQWRMALVNAIANNALALGLVALGFYLARRWFVPD